MQEPTTWRMRPWGVSSSVVSCRAFQGLTRNTAGIAPSFFCRDQKQGQKGRNAMKVRYFMIGVCLVVFVTITGCVSIEEQIASSDPQVHAQGISRARDAAIADLWASQEERIARVKQLDSDEALCQVIIGISTQRERDYFKGLAGKPFDTYYDEGRDYSRVDANVAVIKAAAAMLKKPTNEQLCEIFVVAKKSWHLDDDDPDVPSVKELCQVLDGLAMRLESKEGICDVLTGCSGWGSERKYSLSGETRFKLFRKYIAKEEDVSVLKEIAKEGIDLDNRSYKRETQKAAVGKVTDGEVLVEIVPEVDNEIQKAIFERLVALKDQKSLARLFTEHDVYRFVDEKSQKSEDVTEDKAAELIALVSDKSAIASLASRAKSFHIRSLAIDKLEDQVVLKGIAQKVENSDRSWSDADKEFLQKKAIQKLTDANVLKGLRRISKSIAIKKYVSARMSALGISSVDDIVTAKKYSKDLLMMLDEVADKKDLQKIIDTASLKGAKILAAARIGKEKAITEARKQMVGINGKPENGQFVIDGFYLGMSLEDAFAILYAKYPEVLPSLYVDGDNEEFLNIVLGSKYPCDFACSKVGDLSVYRISFTPDLVGKIIGFKGGSFADLELAVEDYLGVTFGSDIVEKRLQWSVFGIEQINCRIASQKVGTISSIGGETLRFFRSAREKDKNLERNVINSARRNQWDYTVSSVVKAMGEHVDNTLKDVNCIFANEGVIRLCRTTSAPKGLFQANGSFGKPSGNRKQQRLGSGFDDERKNTSDTLEQALDDAKDQVEDALKQLDNMNIPNLQKPLDALRDLGF